MGAMGFVSLWVLPLALVSIIAARWLRGWPRTSVLLVISAVFYGSTSIGALTLLLCVVLASWLGAEIIERYRRASVVAAVLIAILLPLGFAKYVPWLYGIVAGGSWWSSSALGERGIPPGLSFITLQAIGYVIDVHRGLVQPTRRIAEHALFLSFFPQLVAGPIERAHSLRPQLSAPARPQAAEYYAAAKLALWGYTMKLLIADPMARPIGELLSTSGSLAPAALVLALVLFAMRLYFDFFGYSCIAVALGQAHGVKLTMNFGEPYGAVGVGAFWRRWHISLSTWWRDYVYIPIGGRNGRWLMQVAAVGAVFLLSGLWHGAGAGFIVWGGAFAVVLLGERWGRRILQRHAAALWQRFRFLLAPCAAFLTAVVVTVFWLPFLATPERDFPLLIGRFVAALRDFPGTVAGIGALAGTAATPLLLGVLGLAAERTMRARYWGHPIDAPPPVVTDVALTNAMLIGLLLFGDFGGQTFVYFEF